MTADDLGQDTDHTTTNVDEHDGAVEGQVSEGSKRTVPKLYVWAAGVGGLAGVIWFTVQGAHVVHIGWSLAAFLIAIFYLRPNMSDEWLN